MPKTFLVVNFEEKEVLEYSSEEAARDAILRLHGDGIKPILIQGGEVLDFSVRTSTEVTFGADTDGKKRRGGRPKGSKNKPKTSDVLPGQLALKETGVDDEPADVTFTVV